MTFDFTQQPPKPATLAESHKLIECLWTFGRHATEKLNLNSTDSSLSPSQERFKKTTAQSKKKSSWQNRTLAYWKKRKPGAQKGHKGTGRSLLPREKVDQVIYCYPDGACPHCSSSIHVKRICQRKQVFDLTLKGVHITEYQVYDGHCTGCKKNVKGKFPNGLPKGILTTESLSKIALLVAQYRLSRREVKQVARRLF